jgi:hypothetical protein
MIPFFHLSYRSSDTHYKHHCIKRDISCVSEEWIKQGRQYTYKRNIEACSSNNCCRKKPLVLHILSVRLWPYLSIVQCVCDALYWHLFPARLCNILPHFLIECTVFGGKKLLNIRCVFWFCVQLVPEKSLSDI